MPGKLDLAYHEMMPPRLRHPLGTVHSNVGQDVPPANSKKLDSSNPVSYLPHHESIQPNGNFMALTVASPVYGAGTKRLSALVEEDRSSNRNSMSSTNSTNASINGRKRKRHIGPWRLGRTLGAGSMGRVRKAQHVMTGQIAAVKIVGKQTAKIMRSQSVMKMDVIMDGSAWSDDKRRLPFSIEREVVVMKLINHENVIRLFDVWENHGELYLVMEYTPGGELFDHISQNGFLDEMESVRIFRQIISGIAYCHQFCICHRDLKPENILLDVNLNVKIIDFGMTAIAMHESLLETPCGSPHYAAPEICAGKEYRGDKVDIWSCGIILFVMLCGRLPFGMHLDTSDENAVHKVMECIIAGDYSFPSTVGREARDLISRMLMPQPEERILIQDMWNHPLLVRYEGFSKDPKYAATWIGGPPKVLYEEDCGPVIRRPQDIDRELLRNVCILLQTIDEATTAQELLSHHPTYTRVFYNALRKFQLEQEENYQGPPIEFSTSDYHHHVRPMRRSATRTSVHSNVYSRQKSRFSLVEDQVRRPSQHSKRANSVAATTSEHSYDPYRASRAHLAVPDAEYAKITLLERAETDASRQKASDKGSLRHPAMTRIRHGASASDIPSSPPLPLNISILSNSTSRGLSRVRSRSSMASSQRSRRSVNARKPRGYRRPVSFDHIGARSSSHSFQRPQAPSPTTMRGKHRNSAPLLTSPLVEVIPVVEEAEPPKSKKETTRASMVGDSSKTSKRASGFWGEEARIVSTELEKFCDEAFNRDLDDPRTPPKGLSEASMGSFFSSNATTSPMQDLFPIQTTIPNGEYRHVEDFYKHPTGSRASHQVEGARRSCEVPDPVEAQLISHREELYKLVRDGEPGTFDELIKSAENNLIRHRQSKVDSQAQLKTRRTSSAPEASRLELDTISFLSPVKEEEEATPKRSGWKDGKYGLRYVSEPTRRFGILPSTPSRKDKSLRGDTIRLVEASPDLDMTVRPLNVRKSTGPPVLQLPSLKTKSSQDALNAVSSGPTNRFNITRPISPKEEAFLYKLAQTQGFEQAEAIARRAGVNLSDLNINDLKETLSNDSRMSRVPSAGSEGKIAKIDSGESRVKNWFKRKDTTYVQQAEAERQRVVTNASNRPGSVNSMDKSMSDEPRKVSTSQVRRDSMDKATKKVKFLNIFTKKEKSAKAGDMTLISANSEDYEDDNLDDLDSRALAALRNGTRKKMVNSSAKRGEVFQQQPRNWFSRFLHIKPATRVIAMTISRPKALKEVRGILRDWRKYGMRDIVVDKDSGRIWCRVDEQNRLHMRAVSIACEIFAVQHHGRRNYLSLVRFSQMHGSKSSFETVAGTLERVLRDRDVLQKDKKKAKEMKACLKSVALPTEKYGGGQ